MYTRSLGICASTVSLLVAGAMSAYGQTARDYISIVGSSTVYPFATVVAEQFGRTTRFKTPTIESTGSGGGLKLFCAGVGVQHPDIANSSRRITASEVGTCADNGVTDVIEVKIGFDGIVLANSRQAPPVSLTLQAVFLALARDVPDPAGGEHLVANPYRRWNEIDSSLPATVIEVLGPPPTSGTRDAFVELALEHGCSGIPWIKALKSKDKNRFKEICHTIREDGRYVEAGENDNLIVQKLVANPDAFGVFGYSFLEQNEMIVQGAEVEGAAPTFDAIARGDYPISRPLYFYVKKAHVDGIPGIREYLMEFTSPQAMGEDGYLSDKGLIPLPEPERQSIAGRAESLEPLRLAVP